jgi:hypothetical protein
LRESIEGTRVERAFHAGQQVYEGRCQTFDPVAPDVEWPTKPHTIRPREDRGPASVIATRRPRGTVQDGRAALSWVGPGGRHFAKVVHHPGTRGAHMFAIGAAITEAEVPAIAEPALRIFERDVIAPRGKRFGLGGFS